MKTTKLEVIDTFPAFPDFREKTQDLPNDAQIEGWAQDYLSLWPELLTMQVDDYHQQNIDWRSISWVRDLRHRVSIFRPSGVMQKHWKSN